MSLPDDYIAEVQRRVKALEASGTREALARTVDMCASAIENDKMVFSFGTGHGSFAALEMFPRTGTCAGFRPMIETPLSNFHNLFGDMGVNQYRFLHTTEGYGKAIMTSYQFQAGDTMILFSHSGLNAVIVDCAIRARELGMSVVGITSVPHSSQTPPKHSSGLRLFEAADVVIDTGVPLGDAGMTVPGYPYAVGPTSTIVATTITHAIVAGTVQRLVSRGRDPFVMVNPNTAGADEADEQNARVMEEVRRRCSRR